MLASEPKATIPIHINGKTIIPCMRSAIHSIFFMGGIRDSKALEYLKSIGLVDNGRCPICGNMMEDNPGRFTSGYDSSFHFQICQSCARHGKRTSVNPANNSGCMLALLLFPWCAVKSLFCSMSDLF